MTLYTLRKYNLVELDLVCKMWHFFDSIMQLKGTPLSVHGYLEHKSLLYSFPLLTDLSSSVPLHETLLTVFSLKRLFSSPWILITCRLNVWLRFS